MGGRLSQGLILGVGVGVAGGGLEGTRALAGEAVVSDGV